MDIRKGFVVDDGTLLPWFVAQNEAKSIIGEGKYDNVMPEYLVTRCEVFGGLSVSLGLHFRAQRLVEFELFRHVAMDLGDSYREFQDRLEKVFGPPTRSFPGDDQLSCGFASHEWRLGGPQVRHYVLDRFGPEEHVRIHT